MVLGMSVAYAMDSREGFELNTLFKENHNGATLKKAPLLGVEWVRQSLQDAYANKGTLKDQFKEIDPRIMRKESAEKAFSWVMCRTESYCVQKFLTLENQGRFMEILKSLYRKPPEPREAYK